MFNFKVMNRALNDSNLSDKAFRMLYTIINYCSLKNSNSVEVHNAHLMMVLNISERWVRKITNELVEKGYITKKVNGTSQNKLANTYTLIDVEVNDTPTDSLCNDINKDAQKFPLTDRGNNKGNKSDAQKFPLKNNNKINKKYNIHVNIPEVINKNKFINNNTNVDNTDEVNTSDNYKNISVEEQNRYQRLFSKCKSQIEIWMKTHEYSCISMFDAYFKAIEDMKDNKLISVKQWNAAQRYLFQRFNNLRKGYNNYLQKKNKTISSNEVNELITPDPHGSKNGQMEEAV